MIKLEGIKKSYGQKIVLDIQSYTFRENRIYAVMGSNGCGKSSLLKSLIGILNLDEGVVNIGDVNEIHYLPQVPFIFKGSVQSNLFTKDMLNYYIQESDILDKLDQEASSLSGGEKQKMLLLRAIAQNKKILLLDEPTSDMDVEGTIYYEDLLRTYQENTGALIIIVTHSLSQSIRFCDELLFMKDGKIVESGPCDEMIKRQTSDVFERFVQFHQVK